ncbi:MAG TPA: hypothetical protein VIU46_00355, partial [Gallionellaceae bacterium]
AAGLLIGLNSLSAQAATVNSAPFNVTINLTSTCTFTAPTNVVFNYTSFSATVVNATASTFNVTCTNTLPYTVSLLTSPTLLAPAFPVTDSAVGLAYSLAIAAPAGGGTGTGLAQAYQVTGTMAAGQAGNCATAGGACTNAAATNNTYVVTIVY